MKKYKTKFPVARIKKIMQMDEDVGKMSQVTPVLIAKALELFMESIITGSCEFTRARQAKKLQNTHVKQCVKTTEKFDFLRDVVQNIPDPVETAEPPPVQAPKHTNVMDIHAMLVEDQDPKSPSPPVSPSDPKGRGRGGKGRGRGRGAAQGSARSRKKSNESDT